jgi:hypothetical protein
MHRSAKSRTVAPRTVGAAVRASGAAQMYMVLIFAGILTQVTHLAFPYDYGNDNGIKKPPLGC